MQNRTRRNTLRKDERLFERKAIETLFNEGRSYMAAPIRVLWVRNKKESVVPVRAAFSAPSKVFKRAVDRNLIKRQMREAYRQNKSGLFEVALKEHMECLLMFIYTGRTKLPYSEIESKIVVILQHLSKNFVNGKGTGTNS
jgi:ribonuclease P protein component